LGFASGAFDPFYRMMREASLKAADMPDRYALPPLFGIKIGPDGQARTQLVAVVPRPAYEGEAFFSRATATGLVKVFDPALFSKRLGALLQSAFIKMAAIVGIITILTAFLYFLDWRLTLIGIAPTLFAIVCTLGTLNLLGEPLGVPTLMVSVVVIGMGTDYALYLVRAYQRYFDEENPSLRLIRLSFLCHDLLGVRRSGPGR
jgi:predicted exporter